MKNITLYSSQLASFIGKNPHTSVAKTFNKLFDTYFKEYQKDEIRIEVKRVTRSDKKVLDDFFNKHQINLREELDKIIKMNISTKELNLEKKKILEEILKNENLKKEEKEEIYKVVEGYTNKRFGTNKEINAIDYYELVTGENLLKKVEPKRKKVLKLDGYSLTIISRLDAMSSSGEVLEFKNRIYKFFDEIREYEWIQIQTYLEVYNFEDAKLIEFLKKDEPEMKINEISRDKEYWKKILIDLDLYFKTLIKMGTSNLSNYLLLSEKNQDEYIKNKVRETYKENNKL